MKYPVMTAWALALLVSAWACAGRSDHDPGQKSGSTSNVEGGSITELPEPSAGDLATPDGPAIDEPLMIALAQAKNFHHKADVYSSEGKFEQAIDSVQQILGIPFPVGVAEAEDVALDARARLAKLLVTIGKLDEAMATVDQGITTARRQSFFLANLYTARGEVYEAMANRLDDDAADEARAQAAQARRSAIEAFDQSIAINRALQRALTSEGAP